MYIVRWGQSLKARADDENAPPRCSVHSSHPLGTRCRQCAVHIYSAILNPGNGPRGCLWSGGGGGARTIKTRGALYFNLV